jgi:hypothetical protein
MPALFFPNLNALRLALVSGLVPPEIAGGPAAAGFDPHGRLWLEPAEPLPRESLAALARLGVQALGDAGVPTSPVDCWAQLLPLQTAAESHPARVLFLVPERRAARFTARLRRAGCAVGVRLTDDAGGLAWVCVTDAPSHILSEVAEPDSAAEAFVEQSRGVWVRHGWFHPAPAHLVVPHDGSLLLLRPPASVRAVVGEVPSPEAEELRLPACQQRVVADPQPPCPAVVVRLTLAPRREPERETLWVLKATGAAAFWEFCGEADERLLRHLEAAAVGAGDETRLVVRAGGKRGPAFLPLPVTGYAADPRVPDLFVPADRVLRPALRVRELGRALGIGGGHIVWVEPGPDGGVIPHALPASAFRPLTEWIEHRSPPREALRFEPRADPFPLDRFVAASDPVPLPDPESEPAPAANEPEAPAEPRPPSEPGWLRRSLRRLAAHLFPEPPEDDQPSAPVPAAPGGGKPPRPARRVERKLGSPDALLHGRDWAARKRELETRLFRELPRLGPAARAERWADLAGVYWATGNAADAGVCWMNAVWESSAPPAAWFEHWLEAEARGAKLYDTTGGLERCLSEPGRPGGGRVVAAYTAAAGFAASPPPEFLPVLPRLLAFLDQRFDDIPVRALWLARLAAARVCDGDTLGLARWRDRVLARLADRGPRLDLDEPSFLRFHGTASAERFQDARRVLEKLWKPAREWVESHRSKQGGRLQSVGLDAEIDCTAAYAQFMFAWGLGCLGERTLARDWGAQARKGVARGSGPLVEPGVHAVLSDLFLLRVRDAQEGRPAKPGLPADLRARLDALPERRLAQYAVDRLREHSRILEPLDRVLAFRGLDLKAFWGDDRLGERLFVLAGHTDPDSLSEEADDLLRLCRETPASDTVPRVVLTLLERASRLEPPALARVLDLLPAALEWTEAWLAARAWPERERPAAAVRYHARMLGAAFTAAGVAAASAPLTELVRRLGSAAEQLRPALLKASARAFRVLHKLGLVGPAETLVRLLDPTDAGAADDPDRVGLAVGWFAAGNEDEAIRILDEARDALLLEPGPKARVRTPLAVAYADALGFAPARIAHGRLEELFQRLGPVEVDGATAYFTPRLLQIIDAVVRAVVTDEFEIGPSVLAWLEDDEFLIRGRVHRDLAAVLREQGMG